MTAWSGLVFVKRSAYTWYDRHAMPPVNGLNYRVVMRERDSFAQFCVKRSERHDTLHLDFVALHAEWSKGRAQADVRSG